MADDRQERIRERAYAIWEREGRRDGDHERHWHRATSEIDAEDAGPSARPARKVAAPPKATKPAGKAKAAAGAKSDKTAAKPAATAGRTRKLKV